MSDDTTRVSRRLRFEILRRDNHTCRYCGAIAPDVKLTVDHVMPAALGGSNDPTNLVTACVDCNSGKTSTAPAEHHVADVAQSAVRWKQAAEWVAAQRRTELMAQASLINDFDAIWSGWTFYGDQAPRDRQWNTTVETFASAGLTLDELAYFIDVAMNSRATTYQKWKYFCGCCWGEIRKRDEMTRAALEPEPINEPTPAMYVMDDDPDEDEPADTDDNFDPACEHCDGLGLELVDDRLRQCRCWSTVPYQDWATR